MALTLQTTSTGCYRPHRLHPNDTQLLQDETAYSIIILPPRCIPVPHARCFRPHNKVWSQGRSAAAHLWEKMASCTGSCWTFEEAAAAAGELRWISMRTSPPGVMWPLHCGST